MADARSFVADERAALCDLFDGVGPDAPTLSGEWRTHQLAAHLLARESRPDAGPGLVAGGLFAKHTEKVQAGIAERPYAEIVTELRAGPPVWWVGRWVATVDVHEWFVHHEDVRRAGRGAEPRDLSAADDLLWSAIGRFAKPLTRGLEVGLSLLTPDGRSRTVRSGDVSATISGTPGEILLALFGRDVAEVEVTGDPAAVAACEAGSFGI